MKSSNTLVEGESRVDLLDELTRLVGCDFLSNLTRPENSVAVNRALQAIHPQDFTQKAWSDAVAYFCGGTRYFKTVEEAREYLIAKTK